MWIDKTNGCVLDHVAAVSQTMYHTKVPLLTDVMVNNNQKKNPRTSHVGSIEIEPISMYYQLIVS
jgi:hypothetical protein